MIPSEPYGGLAHRSSPFGQVICRGASVRWHSASPVARTDASFASAASCMARQLPTTSSAAIAPPTADVSTAPACSIKDRQDQLALPWIATITLTGATLTTKKVPCRAWHGLEARSGLRQHFAARVTCCKIFCTLTKSIVWRCFCEVTA